MTDFFYTVNSTIQDDKGVVTTTSVEVPYWQLGGSEILTTLLVVNGTITLEEGANATGLNANHLVYEAQSWAAAQDLNFSSTTAPNTEGKNK